MNTRRLFVEKREPYRVEAESLRRELNSNLSLDIKSLRLLCVYDLFGFSDPLIDKCLYKVFGERATDNVSDSVDFGGMSYLAVECLPGQFDQRAASALDCVKLIEPSAEGEIRSARLMIFDESVGEREMERIAHYCINAVESRRKDLSVLAPAERASAGEVPVLEGFRAITAAEAPAYCKEKGLAMNGDDLMEVVGYFTREGRDPNETELRILDTYWSDHCRHTTFTTELEDIEIKPSFISEDLRKSLDLWKDMRRELGREKKSLCLMDLATIGARWLKAHGLLDDLEQSEENNACSVYVDVDNDGRTERWLLMFKNETHNHPTEIEPFGGASTCLGGAIRDPLSGRSYVYQAMRVTGAGNIWQPVGETMKGKLPQRVISQRAAAGYSSYGNQIGLATTHVREIYHPGYVAKRLEVGAVVGAVKASDVRRERPVEGDVILMFGGRTGRDGIGGATGSSKEHNTSSLEQCGSEVQKGNAPEERKIARLFRRPEVTRLIKKSNDFGAGGVSVAIGELTDGLDIYLDRVPTKYSGLNVTEIAISESQERMSVVVEAKDADEFRRYCAEENLEVTHVADVTSTGRMRLFYNGRTVADLSREFIDSAGARHYTTVKVEPVEEKDPFGRIPEGRNLRERFFTLLADKNVTSQKGLIEMFDSSIGASTVLMPFGGKTQRTETQVSVQRFPVESGRTSTASMMAFGFNPYLSSWSPYHGAAYAVVDSIAKAVAAGADWHRMRFSFQEYFEKMSSPSAWGKPLSALLGALRMQKEFGLPSIGGKDSMSGTFADISVPPTLISFGVAPVKDSGEKKGERIVSPEFKQPGSTVYLVRHTPLSGYMPDVEQLKRNFDNVNRLIKEGNVLSAWAVGFGGVAEGLAKMSFGNRVGMAGEISEKDLFGLNYGSIIVECDYPVKDIEGFENIGSTIEEEMLVINGERLLIDEMDKANRDHFCEVYPDRTEENKGMVENAVSDGNTTLWSGEPVEHPLVVLPVFPGTNCDYDMRRAFEAQGFRTKLIVFRNLTAEDVNRSVDELTEAIDSCHVFAVSGGFSQGDEPDGSGKFIASVIQNEKIKGALERLMARKGLLIGICNGFQAFVKSGLLPFGKIGQLTPESPTLFRNDINRHISQIVTTRIGSVASPWLAGFRIGELHSIAVSHGEGKFVASKELVEILRKNGQIAFQYADPSGRATMESPWNPNGSTDAIEGIVSPDGLVIGKMGHTERYVDGLMKNISGNKSQGLFANAAAYFRKK